MCNEIRIAATAFLFALGLAGASVFAQCPACPAATFGAGLPIHFVENRGLYPDEVAYFVQGAGRSVYFTPGGFTVALRGRDRGWALKVEFVNADPGVRPRGESPRRGVFSYFGCGPEDATTGLASYGRIVYAGLWPGVFVDYRGVVAPDGTARAAVKLPALPELIGWKVYTAFVVFDAASPSGVRSISNTASFTVQ